MSPRDWQERVWDILSAIDEINAFTKGFDVEKFVADPRTQRAVEMNFIVIGEAANHIPDEVQERYTEVPWHLMRAMRNRLVHVYFNVDAQILWQTIQEDLPAIVVPLRALAG